MVSGRHAFAIAIMAAISVASAGLADSGHVIEAEYRCQDGQTILARYDNTDPNAINGDQFLTVQATDSQGATGFASSVVTIVGGNDRPELDLNGPDEDFVNFTTTFAVGGGPVNVTDTDATLTDDGTIASLTVRVLGEIDPAAVALSADTTGTAIARLRWRKPGEASFVTVPASRLYAN